MDRYSITKKGDEWRFEREGSNRAIRSGENKSEVVEEMRKYMRSHDGSVRIHKENGVIQEERTYPGSKDPRKSPG